MDPQKTRDEWLEEKRHCIGASEVAAILGESPFAGPFHIYAAKVHGYSASEKRTMTYGRYVERAISKMYKLETGRKVFDYSKVATAIQYHKDIPWLGATLDDTTAGNEENPAPDNYTGDAPLELKNTSGFIHKGGRWQKVSPVEWIEDPPLAYKIQLQIQMACYGSMWGSLAALFPNIQLNWVDHKRNDKFLEAVYPQLEMFWDRVKRRDPPGLDDLPSTLDVVKTMYKEETGDTVTFSEDEEKLVREWVSIREDSSKLAKRKKYLEAQIRYALKDATFAEIPSLGKWVSLKKTHRKGYTKVVEPTEYRVLRIQNKK